MRRALLTTGCLLILCFAHSQDFSLYEKAKFIDGRDTLRYRILYPEKYQPGQSYPVMVFLHGMGERGRDNGKQLVHGGDLFLEPKIRRQYPAIIIFPQCPPDTTWSYFSVRFDSSSNRLGLIFPYREQPQFPERMVKQLTDSLIRAGIADEKRIYIGGLSMGGFGTYDLLIRHPNYYAAAFNICGACNVKLMAEKGKNIPLWIFHGAKDDIVNPSSNRELYAALKKENAPVKYTEYSNANHNSWDPAFAERKLLKWLFSHSK